MSLGRRTKCREIARASWKEISILPTAPEAPARRPSVFRSHRLSLVAGMIDIPSDKRSTQT